MSESTKQIIDRLQGQAGYATGGYVDRAVFSGLDVHFMLNEIEYSLESLTIPKEIVDLLDDELGDCEDKLYIFNERYINMSLPDKLLLYKNYRIISIYLASESLGIKLVEVVE